MKSIGGRRESARISTQHESPKLRSGVFSAHFMLIVATHQTHATPEIEKAHTQSSEPVPSQATPSMEKSVTSMLPWKTPEKRKLTLDNVARAKHGPRTYKSKSPKLKYVAIGSRVPIRRLVDSLD